MADRRRRSASGFDFIASYTGVLPKYLLFLALAMLYLSNLGGVGFIDADEPRYASIGREMAQSGDWITPRLDGQPWFEKSPLLYWMTATGFLAGLPDEWAARLPLALASLAFLIFFHRTLEREFSARVALAATAILGLSAAWVAMSFAAVTDLPMSAALGSAMFLALFGASSVRTREPRIWVYGLWSGAMLGLAMLAKGLVPLVLFAPVFLVARGKRLAILAAASMVAAPWYLICGIVNGPEFWNEFVWRHHVLRFFSGELEHAQPFWFYLPVLLAALFPWTPLAALLARGRTYDDARVRFLMLYLVFGFIFFSISVNKLPGYLLPLMPALAVVLAVGLDKAPNTQASGWLAACAVFLAAVPVIGGILPVALNQGITHTDPRFALGWPYLLVAAAVAYLAWRGDTQAATLLVALAAVVAVGYMKASVFPSLDREVSVRGFWRVNASRLRNACVEPEVPRNWVYGLNYYAARPLETCGETSQPRIGLNQRSALTVRRN